MKNVLVVYATRERHTHRIAEYLANAVRYRGISAEMLDAREIQQGFTLGVYSAVLLAASVHCGKHEREMIEFVKRHVADLERIPTVFLSVSLSEAGAENCLASPEHRAQAAADVTMVIDVFLKETGWHPGRIRAVAGALLYTKYNFLVRFVMKLIARQVGGDTDTSRDYEYTNWTALDQLVDELLSARPAREALVVVQPNADLGRCALSLTVGS